jgi:hypothetical protein
MAQSIPAKLEITELIAIRHGEEGGSAPLTMPRRCSRGWSRA